jgi:Tfp pilus assembly protein PilO
MKIIIPLLLIGAAVGIFFGYTDKNYRSTLVKKDQAVQIDKAKKSAYELNEQRQKLTEMRNKISNSDVNKINKMLPDSVENVGLIIEINNISKKNGMGDIKSPQINQGSSAKSSSKGIDSSKYGSLAMSFNVTGTYDQFLTFIQDLETYVRIVDVTGLSFTATKDGRYTYNITIQTYWLK